MQKEDISVDEVAQPTNPDDDRWEEAEEPRKDDWLDGGERTDVPVWPKPMIYDTKQHNSKIADVFLGQRPTKLIVSDGVIYTLELGKVWRELPEAELAAE